MRRWTVADVMTRDVVSVLPAASYRETVNTLIERKVSAAPVVDEDGRVVGVVSEADLLHKVEEAGQDQRRRSVHVPRRAAGKAHGATAADLMTVPAVTVEQEASVAAAARRLERERVKRLPVVDADGRLVGIVSRRDLLSVHTRTDADIREDVVDDVLRRTLWIEPAEIDVDVKEGVVTFRGPIESRTLADLAVEFTAKVPGVVRVIDLFVPEFDDRGPARSPGYAFGSGRRLVLPGEQ